ncbi:MAG: TRAP transporter small permease subunit [Paracoccaceae bacterium]|jgi:TRAP-type mannitol/chloroaromatic compound transport system permease small subunit|nr:TRAP transporter small permease subunit [Paracoccaceae bacterium]MDP5345738.1 TRAP transporter small permease subunit [Paracoccaceae bacterium]
MPRFIVRYVRLVDWLNYGIGRFAMYLLFVLMGVLLWSTLTKMFATPALWTLEMAQFTMVAYYMLGGPYSMQMGSNVRMDLFYGGWSDRTRAAFDALTIFALMFYLGVLLYGGIDSTIYALSYGERSPSAWRPYIAPVKIISCIGITLMLLQCTAIFFRDVAKLRGEEI